jgi:hypothetical protein
VGANEEEGVAGGRLGEEVDAAEIVVGPELCLGDRRLPGSGGGREGDELGPPSPVRPPDEQEPAVGDGADLIV